MAQFRHILFPVDFSERCLATVPYVKMMCAAHQARLTVMHVVEAPFHWYDRGAVPYEVSEQICNEIMETGNARFNSFICRQFREMTTSPDFAKVCEFGNPASSIVHTACEQEADLIMIPTHGYGPFRKLLLGSVVSKVLHDAQVPVWSAAHIEDEPVPPRIQRILCGVDLGPNTANVFRHALDLSRNFSAELELFYCQPGAEAGIERYLDAGYQVDLANEARELLRQLQETEGVSVNAKVEIGQLVPALKQEALDYGADLVVIGRGCLHETFGRLRTNVHAIIRESPCPVISF